MKKILILTGSSKGIGKAIAEKYLKENYQVIGLSRSKTSFHGYKSTFDWIKTDLSDASTLEISWEGIMQKLGPKEELSELYFIHNAGTLQPIGLLGQGRKAQDFFKGIQVNVAAPLALCEMLISEFQSLPIEKKIVIISSGAGKKPYQGWGMYSSSKAATDMLARVIHEEQQGRESAFRVSAVAPGVVDTDMQNLIREQEKENFPHVQRFLDLKKEGKLWSPDFVAEELFALIQREDFGQEVLRDLRSWRD